MLERFHVPDQEIILIQEENLRNVTEQIFHSQGMPEKDCKLATDALISSDLRGVETHGVSNMVRAYLGAFKSKNINPKPNWKIVKEAPSCITIDSDAGLGIVVAPQAMEIAAEKAKKTGVGLVTLGNGRHIGMLAYHAMIALKYDMIGTCMAACSPRMVPTFSSKKAIGTNPIAYAAPADKLPPFVFDAAMTSVAGNKIALAKRLNVPVAPGWVTDSRGVPILEEQKVPDDGHYMLPTGGSRENGSHKGASLGIWVEIMCGLLGATGAGPNRKGKVSRKTKETSISVVVPQIASFALLLIQ